MPRKAPQYVVVWPRMVQQNSHPDDGLVARVDQQVFTQLAQALEFLGAAATPPDAVLVKGEIIPWKHSAVQVSIPRPPRKKRVSKTTQAALPIETEAKTNGIQDRV